MILLPSGPKVLSKQKREAWSTSLSLPRDQFGNEKQKTVFLLKGRTSDGFVKKFWFEDRDDADAFLFAMAMGTLRYERELWRLPVPHWDPEIGEGLTYEFATVTFLTSTTQATFNKPADWNNSDNFVACIGGGGSGGVSNRASSVNANASGGGGGGCGGYINYTLAANATYLCGPGGAARNRTTSGTTAGLNGTDTYFDATSYAGATVGATAGVGGKGSTSSATSSAGGTGKGSWFNNGGASGAAASTSNTQSATGGGGAGGSTGNGVSSNGTSNNTGRAATDGGGGDNGTDGAGGAGSTSGAGTNGSNGTSYSSSGFGGGGGGSSLAIGLHPQGGNGGNYGGGGGGASGGSTSTADTSVTSGSGAQGAIVVSYTPVSALPGFNLAMIGM